MEKTESIEIKADPGRATDPGHLAELYSKLKSVHKVAKALGHACCAQTVKDRLNASGVELNQNRFSERERAVIRNYYATTPSEMFSLRDLAAKIGRGRISVALQASRMGVTRPRENPRPLSDEARRKISEVQRSVAARRGPRETAAALIAYVASGKNGFRGKHHSEKIKATASSRSKEWLRKHGHPKGMLGKTHSDQAKEKISAAGLGRVRSQESVVKMLKTKEKMGKLYPFGRRNISWKGQWVVVGDTRFYARSRWEANYARYLEWLKSRGEVISWEHEPKTFWFEGVKRGVCSYLPDFSVVRPGGLVEYHEVKGWMDSRSVTKLKRMKKYYPSIPLILVDSDRYRALDREVRSFVPGWESLTALPKKTPSKAGMPSAPGSAKDQTTA